MANCDMCGKDTELFMAEVEGTRMNVCKGCGAFGKIFRKVAPPKPIVQKPRIVQEEEPEIIDAIVENYSQIIKGKRESLGMTQKEFARFISERESLLQNMETGKFEPPIKMAKKLEKALNVKLIEEVVEKKPVMAQNSASEGLTLGDFIKKR